MAASGGPNWWNINTNILRPSPPPPPQINNNFRQHAPPPSSSSWHQDNQVLPESWSQLLMGGLVVEEGKSLSSSSSSSSAGNLSHIHQQAKKLEIWEEQVVMRHDPINSVDHHVKQEKSPNVSYDHRVYENINSTAELIQAAAAAAKPTWFDHQNMPVSSSPKSCVTSLSSNMLDFSNNKADGRRHPPPDHHSSEVRKEKLGDRITALHQIVSPFGKTDTASVLFEVLGYIKFLQSQIEALSLPYLATGSGYNMRRQQPESLEESKKDLRSRGLCLVPISLTLQVGSETNGPNYWAPPAL